MEMIVRQVVVCDDGKIIIMETMRIFMERDRERDVGLSVLNKR